MKKLLLGFLISVLCLSVTGCGSSEEEKLYEKYKTLIDALEKNDYTTAVSEIYALAQGGSSQDEENKDEEEAKIEEAMKAVSYGEWIPTPHYAENDVASFVMNEDGTCVINGETLNWLVERASEDYIRFKVNSGETPKYIVNVGKYSDKAYHYASLSDSEGEYIAEFFNIGEYTIVDLTVDNWEDYFECKETTSVSENAFGEITSFSIQNRYCLKDEYANRVRGDISNVAIEYQYAYITKNCTVDVETQTYQFGENTYPDGKSYTSKSTNSMYNIYLDDDTSSYGFNWAGTSTSEFPETSMTYYYDFEMLRMKGQMYLLNE